jgi:hypothetical protein
VCFVVVVVVVHRSVLLLFGSFTFEIIVVDDGSKGLLTVIVFCFTPACCWFSVLTTFARF